MRWYDRDEKLSKYLDSLKDMDGKERDKIIVEIMGLIKKHNPTLLEDYIGEFPLGLSRRRWYDNDSYLWLLFNGLKYANDELLWEIKKLFEKYYI